MEIKKLLFKRKKGDTEIFPTLIPIILVTLFLVGGVIGIPRNGSDAGVIEQIYAKKIALALDKAKPGTTIEIDITKLYLIAEKNKIAFNQMIKIDNEEKSVWVRLIVGKGYKFYYFSDKQVIWDLTNDEKLILKILTNE